MKYAKIKNGKIKDVINGLAPSDYVEVIKQWKAPTDYPLEFYVTSSNEPIVSVVNNEAHENWGFILKDIESIKNDIYNKQKEKRKLKQLGTFLVGALPVSLKDREDSIIISSLDLEPLRFKAGINQWITLTTTEVVALKSAHRSHVQAAYDWEMDNNETVSALTTHDELLNYLNTN